MPREWKPGDVAMVDGVVCMLVSGRWEHGRMDRFAYDLARSEARPLVVIDYEDPKACRRLRDLFNEQRTDNLQAAGELWEAALTRALREFANPTPPKPEEPTGIGAVVELADGELWVRTPPCLGSEAAWTDQHGDYRGWATLDVVRVLSEGVNV